MSFSRVVINTLFLTPLLFTSSQLLAEEAESFYGDDLADFYGDEEFVSIATGTKKAIHKAPSVATVITADDIKMMGANSVFEVLESVTGIHIYPSNLNRLKPNFSIRGIHTAENPQTLVLVNGDRTTYEWNGSRWNLFNVGIELIDRIEVIRGPGSAVYGADAYSGVVNIITKGVGSVSELEVGAKAGAFETKSAWFNYVNSDNKLKTSINAQWFDTGGDESRIVYSDAMHGFGLDFLSNAPGALDTRRETIDLHAQLEYEGLYGAAWFLKNDAGTGAGAAQALSISDTDVTEVLSLKAGYKFKFNDSTEADISTYYQTYDEEVHFVIYPAGMALPRAFNELGQPTAFTVFTEGLIGEPNAHDKNYGINLITNYSGLDKHNIRTEIGYRYSEEKPEEFKNFGPGVLDGTEDFMDGTLTNVRGTPYIFMLDQSRKLHYLTVQDEWQLASDWELTAGLRYDNYSDFGSTFNPRLALVWQTSHNLTTKFLYGEAFRAPSFAELYAINNPVILGNKDLKPETIRTYEIAFDYRPSFEWQLALNLYSYDSEKLITYIAQGDGSNIAQNSGDQEGYGAEFEANWKPNESFRLKMGYLFWSSPTGHFC